MAGQNAHRNTSARRRTTARAAKVKYLSRSSTMRGPGRTDSWLRAKETGRVEDVKDIEVSSDRDVQFPFAKRKRHRQLAMNGAGIESDDCDDSGCSCLTARCVVLTQGGLGVARDTVQRHVYHRED